MSDIAGYFAWARGLRGPIPVKINADLYRYLGRTEASRAELGLLCEPSPLSADIFQLPLDSLASAFHHLKPAP